MINSVRNTVLSVLNKNNYGYISPADFNLYAKNAQLEIFEEYFSNYNKVINAENLRRSGTDYADTSKTIAELLDLFLVSDYLYPVPFTSITTASPYYTNIYSMPNDIQNVYGSAYLVNKIVYYSPVTSGSCSTSTIPGDMVDLGKDFIADGVSVGDVLFNLTTSQYSEIVGITTFATPNDTILTAQDLVFLGGEQYIVISSTPYSEAERITNGKIDMLNMSHLTTPTIKYPAYTQSLNFVSLYPKVISGLGLIKAVYFRYPKDPKWTYVILSNGEPVFDQTAIDYQDFELPLEDEYRLVVRILQYCGISIREGEVAQYAMVEEQGQQPSFMPQS